MVMMMEVDTKKVNLFLEMERERALLPNVLREDYFPNFVVKSLQELLSTDVDSCTIGGKDNGRGGGVGGSHSKSKATFQINPFESMEGDEECWTDDTLLEDNADFEGTFLLPEDKLDGVGRILKFAKEGVECSLLDKQKLLFQFTNEFEHPCLELLYFMDTEYGLLSLNSYILRVQASAQKSYFQNQFVGFCFSPIAFCAANQDRSNKILSKFLQCFLLTYFCNPCSKPNLIGAKAVAGEILKQITRRLICDDEITKPPHLNHKIVLSMLKDVNIPGSVRTRYFTEQLKYMLSSVDAIQSGTEILQCQEQYADPKKLIALEYFSATVSQMISALRQEEVIQILTSTTETARFNWETLLYFVSVWIQEKRKAAITGLNDFIKSQIREGLTQKNENRVMLGFIIARHCTLVASEMFSRYVNWYTNMFQNETYSPANDLETFTYLTSLLTEWVPIEPSCFLQAHTSYRPFIPAGCREMWNEYLSLAKVRISEYKEVEEAMEFEPNPNDPLQHEVEMAVKAFQTYKKIPQTIHKMWCFQRKYYRDDFLPALLRKPTGVTLSDARLRLIEVLKRDGKIPDEVYKKYKLTRKSS